ncbi:MAG: class I SAM-dependent methyltransferase [Crenarchaeota archaeon]|nr:class I SAM-dependent methyltransferase [Thermoproteota archaeon]
MAWRSKRRVMHAYDVTNELYDERYRAEQQCKYYKAMEFVEVQGFVVIDVGCGSGLFLQKVSVGANFVVGIDISRKLLRKAKHYAALNVDVVQADADYLPFLDCMFGVVFSFTVLQNLPKPAKTLQEIKRIIKKDGKVVITGLKKAFPQTRFHDLIMASGMKTIVFDDEEALNCYITVLTAL